MFPGMNQRMMKQAMKRMGIQQQEIDADEVIIRSGSREIVITEPNVTKINMQGQETFQITGNVHTREKSVQPDINEDDIKTVMEQAHVDKKNAEAALKETKGDIAEAILKLQS